jgi:AMMECR1 domain-containing protein
VDGLLIAAGGRQAVFLPAVWEQLPEPAGFLDHLQLKAGLAPGRWPPDMQSWRFTASKFRRRAGEQPTPSQVA